MKIKKFEELNIWKLALKITKEIYDLTAKKEFSKDFKLKDQIRGAIISVSSNIVEGFEKNNNNEFIRFLKIAKGSVGETRNQLYIALAVNYLTNQEFEKINKELESLANQIGSFICYLEKRKKSSQLVNPPTRKLNNKGIIISYILVFGTIFLILLGGLLGFILLQLRISAQKLAWQQSFQIAEAGMNYYRWCLNNEATQNCSLEKDYQDTLGNNIGKFQIQIDTTSNCGLISSQKIISTGWTFKYPDLKRKVSTFYGRESVAKYSYIINSNVWVGEDHVIRGPYHSNGGIRFDGHNQSTVSSAQETWVCTSSFGCGPWGVGYGIGLCPLECQIINKKCICPGVFSTTQNSNRDLFSFPIPPFDFNAITTDLAQIKNAAQNSGGIYLPPSNQINPQGKGWHLIFQNTGQVEARIITDLSATWAYSLEEGWHYDYFTITSEYTYNTYTIPSSCSVIFVEDNLWPEGQIKGKVTVASANLIDPNKDTDVILQSNLDYTSTDGSDGLTLIGENRVLIGPNSPNYMTLRGILIAQKGRFSRNHYPGNIRQSLKIYGSIVSNGRVGTKWANLGGQIVSGYRERETYIDPYLLYQPPIFTPFISPEFKIVKWEEL